MKDIHMARIVDLKPSAQRKVIKIYNDAFRRQDVPCPACKSNCCASCQPAKGYIYHEYPNKSEMFEQLKQKYGFVELAAEGDPTYRLRRQGKVDHGFFRAGKGCVIPYKERSLICVSFACGQMTESQRESGWAIQNALYKKENIKCK